MDAKEFDKIVKATGKNYWIEDKWDSNCRLMMDEEIILDDSANDDYYGTLSDVRDVFAIYLLEYEIPTELKERDIKYGWRIK